MTRFSIKRLASGGVITNYHCVSRCGHCLYNCSPRRPKDYIDPVLAEKIFKKIASLGCSSVHLGGGEPLLSPEKLIAVASAAQNAGVDIEYVETNSAWFMDNDQAESLLDRMQKAGIRTLLVSISPFHNAHIPFARVKGVIAACRSTGMNIFPWVNGFVRDLTHLGEHQTHSMAEFEAAFGSDYLKRIPDRYWVHMGGRALETFRSVYPLHPVARILENSPLSCSRALSDTSHFHIDLYASYIPGLCAGLAIAMDDLGRPLPSGKYPLLDRLAAGGIRELYDLAVQSYDFVPRRETYLNHCDLCTEIRQFLFEKDSSRFPELAPEGF